MDDGVQVDSVYPRRHPPYPSVELLVFSRVSGLTIFQQMNFARQLPNLVQFLFIKSSMVEDRLDDLLPGFRSLQKFHLVQTNSNIQDTVNVDSSLRALTSNRLNDLAIEGVVIRNSLSLVIQRHSLHLTSLSIENCRISSDMEGADTLLHTLLQCCPSLKNFKCLSIDVRLCCDPALFDQHVWTCTDLENLTVVPDCEPRNDLYTAVQAQEAFFSRIATLSQLKELSFAGCVGKRSFVVEDGLFLLRGMDKLEMVQLASSGLDDCVKLTEQHAEFMAREWPQLKVILGPYHMECRSFVAYLKSHRPDVRVSY
ncbi:MAG: hypothetical protein J3Q66DRAFT_330493 [Benniella sp.]|nr:MAG: hypothetical protein J3Q66DRAFT_330493 [Benniella sp.]